MFVLSLRDSKPSYYHACIPSFLCLGEADKSVLLVFLVFPLSVLYSIGFACVTGGTCCLFPLFSGSSHVFSTVVVLSVFRHGFEEE